MRSCLVLFLLICINATAQQYTAKGHLLGDPHFKLINDGPQTYVLFATAKYRDHVTFRKVFLGPELKPLDSIEYNVPGDAFLYGTGGNKDYTCHTFTISKPVKGIVFLITDKKGEVKYSFTKTKKELSATMKIKDNLRYHSFDPIGFVDDDKVIVQISELSWSYLAAFNIKDGTIVWHTPQRLRLSNVNQTDSVLIGLSHTFRTKRHITTVHFINKYTGTPFKEIALNPKRRDYRQIGAVACNGRSLIIAGEEYSNAKAKHSHFFMTSYNLQGEQNFERIDSLDRLEKYRIMVTGSTFNDNGNLVLLGEAYKPDVKRETEIALAGVLLTAGLGSAAIRTIDKIDFITATVVSPETGEVLNFHSYPVGPWREFPEVFIFGNYAMTKVINKLTLYDVNTPAIPPARYAVIGLMQPIHLTPFGPVSASYKGFNTVVLKIVQPDK